MSLPYLLLKSLRFDNLSRCFVSPKHIEDVWSKDEIHLASCDHHPPCPYIPGPKHPCGLYGTTSDKILQSYSEDADTAIFVMQCFGAHAEIWTEGARVKGMRPVAVVNPMTVPYREEYGSTIFSNGTLVAAYAHKYFIDPNGMPIMMIDWQSAHELVLRKHKELLEDPSYDVDTNSG